LSTAVRAEKIAKSVQRRAQKAVDIIDALVAGKLTIPHNEMELPDLPNPDESDELLSNKKLNAAEKAEKAADDAKKAAEDAEKQSDIVEKAKNTARKATEQIETKRDFAKEAAEEAQRYTDIAKTALDIHRSNKSDM